MTGHTRVVIVGGGIIGCSVLYGLANLGWADTLLVEKRNLTSGSTWHASGNVTYFGHYPSITRLYINSIKAYLQAEKESGHCVGFHSTGSLRLATTQDELESYKRMELLYEDLDVSFKVISATEISEFHPLLVTSNLYGAAVTPTDGHVDASGATHALAKAARLKGAQTRTQCPVLRLDKLPDENWIVRTAAGDIFTEHVVIATSFWARELLQNLGLNLPVYAIEHHELVTDSVPELKNLDFELPTVRDPYVPSNIRQEGDGFLCGVYESEPRPWAVDGIPEDFEEELLVPDTARLEKHLIRLIERLPSMGQIGIKAVNNGPICYTPDGVPLLGPVVSHPGLWLATGFCIGIGTGGGSGEYLADWIVHGKPKYDLPVVHPSRFPNNMEKRTCIDRILRTYASGYTIHTA